MKNVGKLYIKRNKMPCKCLDCEFLAMFDSTCDDPKYGCVLSLDVNTEEGLKLIKDIYKKPIWCRLRRKTGVFSIPKIKRI